MPGEVPGEVAARDPRRERLGGRACGADEVADPRNHGVAHLNPSGEQPVRQQQVGGALPFVQEFVDDRVDAERPSAQRRVPRVETFRPIPATPR
jgi:hypothetical protein